MPDKVALVSINRNAQVRRAVNWYRHSPLSGAVSAATLGRLHVDEQQQKFDPGQDRKLISSWKFQLALPTVFPLCSKNKAPDIV